VRSLDPDKRSCPARLRARCAAACAAGRSRLRQERGSALVEVLVGAVVLSIATVGILNGIDGAQGVGAKNKARSVQATLAQQDIERMRSMPVATLDNFSQTRTLNVAGADYTVVSDTDWVSDKAGIVNCSNTSAKAEYLKLTSTVTSAATGAKTVTETGLLTPSVGALSTSTGSATVQLTGVNGLPHPSGVPVTLTGASSQSATTNALGCAVFGYIPVGSYNISVPGYVTMASSSPATSTMQVYTGRATFTPLQVERPASIRATFLQPSGGNMTASQVIWDRITVKNANLIGGKKTFIRTAGKATTVDATELYPFLDGVGVYAGDCAANDPSLYSTSYFNPSAPRGWTALNPGDALRAVNVEMPMLRVTVRRTSPTNTNFVSSKVMLTPLDGGCTVTATVSAGPFTGVSRVMDIAAPFGSYTLCASNRTNTQSSTARKNTVTVDLRTPVPGTPNRPVTLVTGTTNTATASAGDCF